MHARSLVYLAARARVALALAPQSGHNSAHDTRSRGILRSLEPLGARGPNDFASDGHGGVYCRTSPTSPSDRTVPTPHPGGGAVRGGGASGLARQHRRRRHGANGDAHRLRGIQDRARAERRDRAGGGAASPPRGRVTDKVSATGSAVRTTLFAAGGAGDRAGRQRRVSQRSGYTVQRAARAPSFPAIG